MQLLLDKAETWAHRIGKIPTVRAVFLSGSLATQSATEDSDIDFFIITYPGTIWVSRFWVFLMLKLNRQLAKPHDHRGKICPNHFVTSDYLELQEKNHYSARMFSGNKPLYDPDHLFQRFVSCNSWIMDYGYNWSFYSGKERGVERCQDNGKISLLVRLLGLSEPFFRGFQERKIQKNPDFRKPGSCIILSDQELRFHPVMKSKL